MPATTRNPSFSMAAASWRMPRPAAPLASKSSSMIAIGNACANSIGRTLELELAGKLDPCVRVRCAVLVLELAPQQLRARHHVLGRVPEEISRGVAALLERGVGLAVGRSLPMRAGADRAAVLVAPIVVVVQVPAERWDRLGLGRRGRARRGREIHAAVVH